MFVYLNVAVQSAQVLSQNSGIPLTTDLGKYLGISLVHNRKTKGQFKEVIDRISTRLSGWKTKFLSLMGRTTLIQNVTVAIPNYTMQRS